jgi:hypothetical protein
MTSGRKVTLKEDLPNNSRKVCLRSPKAFSTTQRPRRSLRLKKCSTTPEFSLPLCGVISQGNRGKPLSPTSYGANLGSAKRVSNKVFCWAKWYKELSFVRSNDENVVFIKMRHFSDFETYSHILQVQFFPSKIQF